MHVWHYVIWRLVGYRAAIAIQVLINPFLEEVIRIYLGEQSLHVEQACIAIACPIDGDQVSMTNHS